MIYKKINGKICVARVYDRFPIDYSDWESRSPNWINSALAMIGSYPSLEIARTAVSVTNFRGILPTDMRLLEAITYYNKRLPRIDKINTKNATDLANQSVYQYSYELDNNGYFYTTFEEDTDDNVLVYYKILPVELDSTLNIYFPLVPENEYVLDAIDWYILKRIIERGHKVPGYSLEARSEFTNPAIAWEQKRKLARNKITVMDEDEREKISRIIRTFLLDYNSYTDSIKQY